MNDLDPTEGLSPEARRLLDDVRSAHDPAPGDKARVRRGLAAALGTGAGLAATGAASSAAASATAATAGAATGLSLGAKIAAVVLVVGAVGGTVAVTEPWAPPDEASVADGDSRAGLAAREAAAGPASAAPTGGVDRAGDVGATSAAEAATTEGAGSTSAHEPAVLATDGPTNTHGAAVGQTTESAGPTGGTATATEAEATPHGAAMRDDQPADGAPAFDPEGRSSRVSRTDGPPATGRSGARERSGAAAARGSRARAGAPRAGRGRGAVPGRTGGERAGRSADGVEPTGAEGAQAGASGLAAEVALLRRAQGAIRAGDPDGALRHLAAHARRFPSGMMTEEREAARVVALCDAGRNDEARGVARRFLRERPGSPLAARVRAACD